MLTRSLLSVLLISGQALLTITADFDGHTLSFPIYQSTPSLREYPPLLENNDDYDPATSSLYPDLPPTVTLKSRPTVVYRPRYPLPFRSAQLEPASSAVIGLPQWDQIPTQGPDIEDKHTLAQLARLAGNAYAFPTKRKYEVDPAWNDVRSARSLPPPS